jgi:hypothetical protein
MTAPSVVRAVSRPPRSAARTHLAEWFLVGVLALIATAASSAIVLLAITSVSTP